MKVSNELRSVPPNVASRKGQLHNQGGKFVALERRRAFDEKNKISDLIKTGSGHVLFSGEKGFEHLVHKYGRIYIRGRQTEFVRAFCCDEILKTTEYNTFENVVSKHVCEAGSSGSQLNGSQLNGSQSSISEVAIVPPPTESSGMVLRKTTSLLRKSYMPIKTMKRPTKSKSRKARYSKTIAKQVEHVTVLSDDSDNSSHSSHGREPDSTLREQNDIDDSFLNNFLGLDDTELMNELAPIQNVPPMELSFESLLDQLKNERHKLLKQIENLRIDAIKDKLLIAECDWYKSKLNESQEKNYRLMIENQQLRCKLESIYLNKDRSPIVVDLEKEQS